MASELKVGDVVQLNSGGPQMTVTIVAAETVQCEWHGDYASRAVRDEFKIECVTKIKESE